jgi:transcriptional regulator with XRE-family HTH domain
MKISDELKTLRDFLGLTRRSVSDMLGVTEQTIYNWETEKGEPSASQMDRLRGLLKKELV